MMRSYSLFLIFLAGIIFQTSDATAQAVNLLGPRLFVHTPIATEGFKSFTFSYDSDPPWGGDIAGNSWANIPLIKAFDSLACNTLVNGTGSFPSLAGSFALAYRGDCSFVTKAGYAQAAGAIGIIIVNNVDVPVTIGMSEDPASPFAGTITIPVLMISKADGDAINTLINAGESATISLTNWGFNQPNDLAIVPYSVSAFHAMAIPYKQLNAGNNNPDAYSDYTAALVANTGTSTELNVGVSRILNFSPAGGGATTTLLADTLLYTAFDPLDSVNIYYSSVPNHFHVNEAGTLTFDYNVFSDAFDNIPFDNSFSYDVYATDSVYSKSRYNIATGDPMHDIFYRHSSAPMLLCGPMFYVQNGGHVARKIRASMMMSGDEDHVGIQSHSDVYFYIYKWVDMNGDGYPDIGEFEMVSASAKQFSTADTNGRYFDVVVSDMNGDPNGKVVLEDETWYWVTVENPNDMFVATDDKTSFYSRLVSAKQGVTPRLEYYAPMYPGDHYTFISADPSTDTMMLFPFINRFYRDIDSLGYFNVTGRVPSLALHVSENNIAVHVNEIPAVKSILDIYPNPATDLINVTIESDKIITKAEYRILDGAGRIVSKGSVQSAGNNRLQISTANIASGTYYVVISSDAGHHAAKKFVVQK